MKKNLIIYVSLLLALVSSRVTSAPVQAQQESLDTTLARATAKSFLITLTRPELSWLMEFYLLDSVKNDSIVPTLQQTSVTSFEITGAEWVSDVTFQVKATLQPGNRAIAVYTGKYGGRWRVEGIDLSPALAAGAASQASGSSEAVVVTTSPATVVSNNGSGQLVFQTQSGGEIYLINASGSGLRRVTQGMDPQLSPDGSKIAFTRWAPRYELFTINLDGSGEQAWTHGWRQMKSPTWSADGSRLVFSYQSGGRLAGERHRVNLTLAAMEGDAPRIPPEAIDFEEVVLDGMTYLYYYLPADAYWFLKQVDLNTVALSDLITERHSYGPAGHPTEANLLVYKSNTGIALHNLGSNTDQAVSQDHRDHTPVVSPDGSRVAVSYWQDGHWEVQVLNLDGSGRQRLTQTPLKVLAERNQLVSQEVAGKMRFVPVENPHWNSAAPVWSPDGSKIAFVTDRRGQWEIWIMNADGSDQRPMFAEGTLAGLTLNYAGVDERMLSWR